MIKYIKGDLVRDGGNFEVIAHGCNCFCNMGSGIAPQIKKKYPEAWEVDCATSVGDIDKLGTISYTKNTTPIVVNAYTQFGCNKHMININYKAFTRCMKAIKRTFTGKRIAMPKIGAGLARGDWNELVKIIEKELRNEDVTVVLWEKNANLVDAERLLGETVND